VRAAREALTGFIVLLANAVIMSVEMLATRMLFPHYGNTVFTWSAVITTIIAGLFLGYMLGGIAAERSKDREGLLGGELLAAGALVALVPLLFDAVLLEPQAAAVFPPLLGCFLVFGVPAVALAASPPAAVGILADGGRGASLAAGMVSSLAAAGSILGTLGTTFWLIPSHGIRSLFPAYGAVLGLLALACWLGPGRRRRGKALAAAVIYAGLLLWADRASGASSAPGEVFHKDSAYQLVRVFEQGSGPGLTRTMMLDSTQEGAMRIETKDVVFGYTRAYKVFPNAFGTDAAARVLFVGGGAYAMPIRTAESMPRASVEVAEIDPVVRDAGERYFRAAEATNLRTVIGDGRQVLRRSEGSYDGVFIDAYQGVLAIPFHLTTREFFEETRRALRPGGFVALNLIGDPTEREGLLCAVSATLESVFPRVDVVPIHGFVPGTQNVILVAGETRREGLFKGTGFPPGRMSAGLACRKGEPLADDFAPVEWLVARYIRSGE
jgi:spermidine synthase